MNNFPENKMNQHKNAKSVMIKKMVFAMLLCSFILPATTLKAQEYDELTKYDKNQVQTLFKKDKRDGFYLSVSSGYANIDNKDAITFSTRSCLIMDHIFAIGVGGTGFVNNISSLDNMVLDSENTNTEHVLAGGYGGLVLEPIVWGLKPVHLSFPVLVGMGATASVDSKSDEYFHVDTREDVFFVVEPMVELEVNFTRFMRIAAYGGYRFTSKLDIENVSPTALNNFSVGVTLKLGLF